MERERELDSISGKLDETKRSISFLARQVNQVVDQAVWWMREKER